MSVLMTGGTGFLGRRICRELALQGERIVVLVRPTTSIAEMDDFLPGSVRLVTIDGKSDAIASAFETFGSIDTVIHCATCYGRNRESVLSVLQTNLLFSLDILTQSIRAECPFFLNVASLLPRGLNPYALSKAQFSEWGNLLTQGSSTFFVDAAIEYMYGGTLEEGGFLAKVVSGLLDDVPALELTSGEQKRDFVHVDDVARIIVYLVEKRELLRSRGYHSVQIGTGDSVAMREIVELIADLCGGETELHFGAVPYRTGENMSMKVDISTLEKLNYPCETIKKAQEGIIEYVECAQRMRASERH